MRPLSLDPNHAHSTRKWPRSPNQRGAKPIRTHAKLLLEGMAINVHYVVSSSFISTIADLDCLSSVTVILFRERSHAKVTFQLLSLPISVNQYSSTGVRPVGSFLRSVASTHTFSSLVLRPPTVFLNRLVSSSVVVPLR